MPIKFDLETRTARLAANILIFTKSVPRTIQCTEIVRQVVRSAGSVGANYIEANEALSRKDFIFRIKICKKEAKETIFWLRLLLNMEVSLERIAMPLIQEASELIRIFVKIVESTEKNDKKCLTK
jgi:four helix bundle protein